MFKKQIGAKQNTVFVTAISSHLAEYIKHLSMHSNITQSDKKKKRIRNPPRLTILTTDKCKNKILILVKLILIRSWKLKRPHPEATCSSCLRRKHNDLSKKCYCVSREQQ